MKKGPPASFAVEIHRDEATRTYYIELTLLPLGLQFIIQREMIEDLWAKIQRMEAEGYRYEAVKVPRPAGVS